MVKIGIIGIGFMGMIHYYGTKKVNGGEVVAIATRNEKKLQGDWTSIQGNFGPRGGHEDLSKIRTYQKIDDILADPDIDLIDICLPTSRHKDVVISALSAGKNVLVEKPIAIELDDAIEMTETAEKFGKKLMVAHVLPFFAEFNYALNLVKSGKHGDLIGGHFRRLTSRSANTPSAASLEKSGGPGIDLHIHDTHFIQLLCGNPDAVYSRGKLIGDRFSSYLTTQYIYNNRSINISCTSGSISAKSRPFTHGFELFFEDATLIFEFATLGGEGVAVQPLTLLTNDGEIEKIELGESDPISAFTAEIDYAVEAIRNDTDPTLLSGEGARNALTLCHKEVESIRTGKIVSTKI